MTATVLFHENQTDENRTIEPRGPIDLLPTIFALADATLVERLGRLAQRHGVAHSCSAQQLPTVIVNEMMQSGKWAGLTGSSLIPSEPLVASCPTGMKPSNMIQRTTWAGNARYFLRLERLAMTDDVPTMGRTLWNWLASGSNDAEMWTRFVRHYYGPLVRWAYSTLRPDRAAAETVAEDVLLSVRRRFLKRTPVRLNQNRSLRSYLWKCVMRLALKRRVKAGKHHDRFRALTPQQCDDLCTAESRHIFQRSIQSAEWLNSQALTLRDSYRLAIVGLRAAPQFSEGSFAAFLAHYGRGENFIDLSAETGEKAGTVARNARRVFTRVCLLMGLPIVEKRDKKRAEAILRLVTHDDASYGI